MTSRQSHPDEPFEPMSDSELRNGLELMVRRLAEAGSLEQARLLHELGVHQIELEMQNRELRAAQEELQAAQDRYADLFEQAPVGFLVLDEKGIIRQLNLSAIRLLGRLRQSLVAHSLGPYVQGDDIGRFFGHLKQVFHGEGRAVDELTLHPPAGDAVPVRLESVRSYSPDEEPRCRTAVIDLREQRLAEAEARCQRDALIHAGRLATLGEMVSGIVHELAQPMGAIDMYAQVCRAVLERDDDPFAEIAELVERIGQQSERANQLLQSFRRFSRKTPFEGSPVDVMSIIEDSLDLVHSERGSTAARVVVNTTGLVPKVCVHRLRVSQVIVNLMRNAMDALAETGNDNGEVRIEVRALGTDWVEVTVRDNGPGVAPEMQAGLFMPFHTSKPDGLGLGLSLSRSIIESHGGRLVLVTDDPAPGATFQLTLPVR